MDVSASKANPRRRLLVLALALLMLGALLAGALALPGWARRHAEQALAEATGGTARIAALGLDPLRLALRVDGLYLSDPAGALLLAADAIMADLAVDSLWTRSVHLDALTVRGARAQLGLLEGGGITPRLPPGGDGGPAPRVRIDRLSVDGSALVVRDASAQPVATLRLTDLAASMTGFDSQAAKPVPVLLRGRASAGTLRLQADLVPAPLALEGSFSAHGIDAKPALAYLERALPLKAHGGRIDAEAGLSLAAGGAVRISDGRVSLRQSALADAAYAPLAQIAELAVDGLAVDLAARRVSVGRISGRDNWLAVARGPDGRINLQNLAGPAGSDQTASDSPAWQVILGTLALTGQRLSIRDETVQPALQQEVTLEQVDIGALGSTDRVPVNVAASLADGGTLTVTGQAILPAGPAELEVVAKGLPLPPLAPYLPDLGPLAVRSGSAAATGQLTLGENGPQYRGQATLSRVELWDTERDEALLGLRTFRVDDLVAGAQGVTSSKIWINRPALRVVITQNRQSNLARFGPRRVAPVTATPTAPDSPEPAPMRFKVDTVRVSRGTLNIEDQSLEPHFAVSIEQLKGDIDDLASDATQPARVALTGRIDQYAPASVEGSFTVGVPRQAAFKLSFSGVEMATFAPYVGKFAGYRIERGRLDVDLDYAIRGSRVRGSNKIVLDRLVLGARVESAEAIDLPLTLALAVLKDSRGVIDVALPLRGDLSNPQFDYGALIGMAIKSLLVKAVKSPFTLLASLVGGTASDLRTVGFGLGSAQLPPVQLENLKKVAQALIARPQLALDIHPRVDQNDGRALAQQALAAAIGPVADDEGDDEADLTEALLKLYEERFGTEPPPVPPPAGVAPDEQAPRAATARAGRERLLAAMAPDAEALRALAQARGEAIRAALMDNGVAATRLAITLPPEAVTLPASASSELLLSGG